MSSRKRKPTKGAKAREDDTPDNDATATLQPLLAAAEPKIKSKEIEIEDGQDPTSKVSIAKRHLQALEEAAGGAAGHSGRQREEQQQQQHDQAAVGEHALSNGRVREGLSKLKAAVVLRGDTAGAVSSISTRRHVREAATAAAQAVLSGTPKVLMIAGTSAALLLALCSATIVWSAASMHHSQFELTQELKQLSSSIREIEQRVNEATAMLQPTQVAAHSDQTSSMHSLLQEHAGGLRDAVDELAVVKTVLNELRSNLSCMQPSSPAGMLNRDGELALVKASSSSCDVLQLQHQFGPILKTYIEEHSTVATSSSRLLQLHSVLSALFKRPHVHVHTLATDITSTANNIDCLPLAMPPAAVAGASNRETRPFVKLLVSSGETTSNLKQHVKLQDDIRLAAITFMHRARGRDTRAALHRFVLSHQPGYANSQQDTGSFSNGDAGWLPFGSAEYEAVRPSEDCETVILNGQAPLPVSDGHAILRLEVIDNFGNAEYVCLPELLIHARTGQEA